MSRGSRSSPRRWGARGGGAIVLAALLAGCGESPGTERRDPAPAEAGATSQDATPSPAAGALVGSGFLPPRPPQVRASADPMVEACIEKKVQGKEFDSLAPRDARRRLRRLQVKSECEERLAGR